MGETTYSCVIFFITHCIILRTNHCKPTFAPPCIFTFHKVLARTGTEAEDTREGSRLETQKDPKKMFQSSTRAREVSLLVLVSPLTDRTRPTHTSRTTGFLGAQQLKHLPHSEAPSQTGPESGPDQCLGTHGPVELTHEINHCPRYIMVHVSGWEVLFTNTPLGPRP